MYVCICMYVCMYVCYKCKILYASDSYSEMCHYFQQRRQVAYVMFLHMNTLTYTIPIS